MTPQKCAITNCMNDQMINGVVEICLSSNGFRSENPEYPTIQVRVCYNHHRDISKGLLRDVSIGANPWTTSSN